MKYAILVGAILLASCAHKGDLKTPAQSELKQQKDAAKAKKEATN